MSAYIPVGNAEYELHSTPAVNDCIYRQMHLFRRIAVHDLDEVIVAHSSDASPRLIDLVDSLDRSYINRLAPVPVNYVFRNSYYFTDLPTDPDDPWSSAGNLTMLRHRKKVTHAVLL
jgi:Glycosyltransferase family 92